MLTLEKSQTVRRKKVKNKSSYNLSLKERNIEQVNLIVNPPNLSQYVDELIEQDIQKKQIKSETLNFYKNLFKDIKKDATKGIIVNNKEEEEAFYRSIGLSEYKLHSK